MMKLSDKNKVMQLNGIKMIGNVDTHCLIGLSNEGNELLQRIIAGEELFGFHFLFLLLFRKLI